MINAIGNDILDLLLLALLWLVSAGLGRLALARLGLADSLTALERLLLGGALGLGIISTVTLLVGWAGFLSVLPISTLLLILIAVAAIQARGVLVDSGAALRGLRNLFHQPLTALLTLIMLVAAAAALTGALAPPTDWDPMVYHLAFPKLYVAQGRISDILFDHRGQFPENGEMLYTLALVFARQGLTGLIHWSMALVSAVATYSFCRARLAANRSFSLLAAAIFFTTPLTLSQATTENIDLNVAFYNFVALYAFFIWTGFGKQRLVPAEGRINPTLTEDDYTQPNFKPNRSAPSNQPAALVLTGLLSGLSYGVKQSSVINGVAIAVLIGWWILIAERRGLVALIKALAIYGVATLAALFIWPLKAWLASGNPFWPAAYSIFGGKAWSQADADFQTYGYNVVYGMRYPAGTTWNELGTSQPQDLVSAYLLWPWNATMFSGKFDAGARWFHSIGPLYLALLPVGAIAGLARRVSARSPILLLSIYALLYIVGWMFFIHHLVRFFLFALPVLAILVTAAGYLLMGKDMKEGETGKGYRYAPIIAAAIGLFVLMGTVDQTYIARNTVAVASGAQTQRDYLYAHWQPYATLDWANQNLPAEAKVLMGWGALAYYLDRPFIYAEHAPEYVGRYINRPPQEFQARLKQLGITHIIISNPEQMPIREVFPPDFIADDGPYTQRISPDGLPWKVYVLK